MVFILWIACGVIGAMIGSGKGEAFSSGCLGLLLGPIGIIIALVSSGNRIKCPLCKGVIPKDAAICMHCRSDLRPEKPAARDLGPPLAPLPDADDEDETGPDREGAALFTVAVILIVGVGGIWLINRSNREPEPQPGHFAAPVFQPSPAPPSTPGPTHDPSPSPKPAKKKKSGAG